MGNKNNIQSLPESYLKHWENTADYSTSMKIKSKIRRETDILICQPDKNVLIVSRFVYLLISNLALSEILRYLNQ